VSAAELEPLRHVSGVLGSFTCGMAGQVISADMPERYSLAELERTAARLLNLFETVEESVPDCQSLRLGFPEHHMLVRRHSSGLLCVLTTSEFDRQMLQVTTRLVLKRLRAPGSASADVVD
jgi:hypothetical protein